MLPTVGGGGRAVWRPVLWRGAAIVAAFLCGWLALLAGVGVTERDMLGAGPVERFYYVLGLFVMGGMDLGTPTGGPLYARALLWTAYFAAPLITASAVIEAAVRLVSPLALRVRPYRDHVVLGGAGRLTMLYVSRLRAEQPRRTIVVVERTPNHPAIDELRDVHRAIVIVGDVTNDEVLGRLRLDRARRALFLTGDDFVNLDAAAKVLKLAPALAGRIVVHVSDLGFMRETAESSVARDCEIFNAHESAATILVHEHLLARFRSTPTRDFVVLAGFGRFGQTVLYQLQERALGSFGDVLIIDEAATRNARAFAERPGFHDDYRHAIVDGDVLDPDMWRRVGEAVREKRRDPVVVLGTGNDGTNLHAALLARKEHPTAYLIVRSFRASPFTEQIARETNLEAFDLAGLLRDGMPPAWF
jgi:Trk K+ transport system NAD-binding subunit